MYIGLAAECRSLPGVGGAATVRPLAANIGILILIAKLESQVVDNVADALDDISALGQVALGSLAANVLEADDGIGVGGGGEARQDTLLSQEKGASADGQESAPGNRWVSKEADNFDVLSVALKMWVCAHSLVGSCFWISL